jgi:hypothetical protein
VPRNTGTSIVGGGITSPGRESSSDAAGLHGHNRRRRNLDRGLGQQGGDLRCRCRAVLGPAGGLADIDGAQRRAVLDFAGDLMEQRRFLGTGHDDPPALGDFTAEIVDLRPAQLARDLRRPRRTAGPGQRLAVQRHCVLAIAEQDPSTVELHPCVPPQPVSFGSSQSHRPRRSYHNSAPRTKGAVMK